MSILLQRMNDCIEFLANDDYIGCLVAISTWESHMVDSKLTNRNWC